MSEAPADVSLWPERLEGILQKEFPQLDAHMQRVLKQVGAAPPAPAVDASLGRRWLAR